MLVGARPHMTSTALCLDCKRKQLVCVSSPKATLPGPVTETGCGVFCRATIARVFSCFGPAPQPNTASLAGWFGRPGTDAEHIRRLFRTFYCEAPAFSKRVRRMPDGERTIRIDALARVEGEAP